MSGAAAAGSYLVVPFGHRQGVGDSQPIAMNFKISGFAGITRVTEEVHTS